MNVLKLKGKIVENGLTLTAFSEKIKIPYATLYRRLENEGADFTIGEVERIVSALNLSTNEAIDIFLPEKSQKCEQ